MKGRFTTGERRGLIALLAVMAIFVAVVALRSGVWHSEAPQLPDSETTAAAATPAVSIDSAASTVAESPKKQRPKRSSRKAAPPLTPLRDPLGEQNNR